MRKILAVLLVSLVALLPAVLGQTVVATKVTAQSMSSRVLELISERKSMRRQLLVPQDRSVRSWYRQVRQPNSLRALSFSPTRRSLARP
jgi:hypothetical protein